MYAWNKKASRSLATFQTVDGLTTAATVGGFAARERGYDLPAIVLVGKGILPKPPLPLMLACLLATAATLLFPQP